MSNIELTEISAPGLDSGSYGANIKTQFDNIDSNFTKIVQGEYLKGQSGDIVMLEEIDLLNSTLQIKDDFLEYISKFGLSSNGIGSINSQKLYMIYTKNEETEGTVYKSSLPYTFLDPRFNPVSDSVKNEGSEDKSCIIIYDESEGGRFKSYNAFPNIYFASNQDEFCWKINGQKTLLPARGPKGDTGYTGAVYILSADLPDGYELQTPQYVKVKFLITPAEYGQWNESNISNEVAEKLKGQAAFVYANVKDDNENNKQYIYISQIEISEDNGNIYAVCLLDESCEIHHVFANQTLKDVLTEVKPESDFNYLFIPSKFDGNKLVDAHVVTTKRSDDNTTAPRPGYWWTEYNQENWKNLADPNICIISPAAIGSTTRTLKDQRDSSNILYNNYKTNICPGDAYFGRIATGSICFDDATNSRNNKWTISQNPQDYTLLMGGPIAGGNENLVDISNSSLRVGKNLSAGGNVTVTGELSVGGNVTIESDLVLKNVMKPVEGNTSFLLDALTGSMRLHDLYVTGPATIGELESLNYKVPSLVLSNDYNNNIPNPQTISRHLVYLTWDTRNTDRDIPTITNISNQGGQSKNFLQAGKPKYIINTTEISGGPSISGRVPTEIHLSFDMSKDWPPTQIEWNFKRTPETISFANGKVNIYTDFRINTGEDTDNVIEVRNEASGINFANYSGELNQVTSILLTPYDAASAPDCKAYKLTFENASAFTYVGELTGIENNLLEQLSKLEDKIANDYMPKTTEIPVLFADNDNITIQSGNNSFVFPTNINNKIQSQVEATLSDKNFVTKDSISWGDIKGAPEIPALKMENDNIIIQSGDDSFILPTNLNSKIQTQIEATLSGKDFVTKGTLTMMGGFNSSNSGTNPGNIEPTIQMLNQQSEGYTITDFCDFIVQYLENGEPITKSKYFILPVKGNVIRGVYHPSEPSGSLIMIIGIGTKSEKMKITVKDHEGNDQQIDVEIKEVKIDGIDPKSGISCTYGATKTLPWEVKLVGDESSELESVRNFKTTVSGYLTITYEAL